MFPARLGAATRASAVRLPAETAAKTHAGTRRAHHFKQPLLRMLPIRACMQYTGKWKCACILVRACTTVAVVRCPCMQPAWMEGGGAERPSTAAPALPEVDAAPAVPFSAAEAAAAEHAIVTSATFGTVAFRPRDASVDHFRVARLEHCQVGDSAFESSRREFDRRAAAADLDRCRRTCRAAKRRKKARDPSAAYKGPWENASSGAGDAEADGGACAKGAPAPVEAEVSGGGGVGGGDDGGDGGGGGVEASGNVPAGTEDEGSETSPRAPAPEGGEKSGGELGNAGSGQEAAGTGPAAAAPAPVAAAPKPAAAGLSQPSTPVERAIAASTSVFHPKGEEVDYAGRSWALPPLKSIAEADRLRAAAEDRKSMCTLPKKVLHTFYGHSMGVQAIRFYPKTGHLLLSASLDGKLKIWRTSCDGAGRKLMRTYVTDTGKGVRDVNFAPGGRYFYSTGFDKVTRLWDVEQGRCLQAFSSDTLAYCVSVHPKDGTSIITGCKNKKALQYDARTGGVVQEYAEHLGPVNTVTFLEDGQRVATTSDDKKLFLWEYGMGVVIKHIAEPHMHAMPAARLSADQKWLACQSMANQVVIYEASGRYRAQNSKKFSGHSSAGYAISPDFSWDGSYVVSGDSGGRLFFWDWRSGRNVQTLAGHAEVCVGTEWHPGERGQVASCSWDGTVKLWG